MARRCGVEPLLILALLAPAAAAFAARPESALEQKQRAEQSRLEKIQAEIVELKQRLAGTEARAGSVLDAIEELDLTASLLAREAESLREDARGVRDRESETATQAVGLETSISDTERELGQFLREVYKVGPISESLREDARGVRDRESETATQAVGLETSISDTERELGQFLREVYKVGP